MPFQNYDYGQAMYGNQLAAQEDARRQQEEARRQAESDLRLKAGKAELGEFLRNQDQRDLLNIANTMGKLEDTLGPEKAVEFMNKAYGTRGYKFEVSPDKYLMFMHFPNGQIVQLDKRDSSIKELQPSSETFGEVPAAGTIYSRKTGEPVFTAPEKTPNPPAPSVYGDFSSGDPARKALAEDYLKKSRRPVAGGTAPAAVPTGATPEDKLSQVPEKFRPTIKGLLEYRVPYPSAMALRSPEWMYMINAANAIDPTFDAKEYPTRLKMTQAYTSATGGAAKQINAINTVLGHAGVLGEAISALETGNLQAINEVANFVGVQTGRDPVTTFNAIVNRVGPELVNAYVGTGGEYGERKMNAADFSPAMSPQQLKSNVSVTVRLLRSKIGSLENQWKRTMKRDDFEERFITPEAQMVIDKWSPKSSGIQSGNAKVLRDTSKSGKPIISRDGGKTWEYE